MPIPDNSLSTLEQIRTKVRRLTRSLSESQLTTAQLDDYINTFVLYDFPESIRLFNLKKTFEFFTEPYVDVYESSNDINSPLYNFINKITTVHPPVYIAGYQAMLSSSREEFYGIYPMLNSIASIGTTGNGALIQFSGVINSQQAIIPTGFNQNICLVRNQVLFSSIDVNGNGLSMVDYPVNATMGNLYVPGTSPSSTTVVDPNNYINYTTGQYTVTFPAAPAIGQAINSQTVPVQTAMPNAILFYDGKFTVRPVPDQPYKIIMDAFVRPTELLQASNAPELAEWWQYIAYGAAKKVFEDRMDLESVQMITPEFKAQETLILRRTIVQNSNERVATIYSQSNTIGGSYGPGFWPNY
jgi:hypothetical protein